MKNKKAFRRAAGSSSMDLLKTPVIDQHKQDHPSSRIQLQGRNIKVPGTDVIPALFSLKQLLLESQLMPLPQDPTIASSLYREPGSNGVNQ